MDKEKVKNNLLLPATLIFVYILLFEFILPVNRILPKPSLVIESLPFVFGDYNLFISVCYTMSIIYSAMLLSYLSLYFQSPKIFFFMSDLEGTIIKFRFLKNIPVLLPVVLLSLWFNSNPVFVEILLVLFISQILADRNLLKSFRNIPASYILVARNLGLGQNDIVKKIFRKYSEPELIREYSGIHRYLWGICLLFEFVVNNRGIGSVLKAVLSYNDTTAFCLIALITIILIAAGDGILKLIRRKFFLWAE
jgi:ABC-type nitrate/sulfonate/bicarbonate transport system permease component